MENKLSVIVPVYNAEEYLKQCVDSILRQNYAPMELILVDDGSTDQSGSICDEYVKQDKRVKVIHQKNQGHTVARKNGFAASDGSYIILIDSDDWIEEGMFTRMMEKAEKENADIVQCSYRSVKQGADRDEVPVFREGFYDKRALEEEIYPRMIYAGGYYRFGIAPNMWNKIFKRVLAEKYLPGIDKRIRSGEDGLFTFACFLEAERVYILHDCFYNYRSREISMCRITDDKRLEENHLLFKYYQIYFMHNKILQNQIMHYVVYQTLQAVEELLHSKKFRQIKKLFASMGAESLECTSIKNVKLSEVKGKRNKLILAGLKL